MSIKGTMSLEEYFHGGIFTSLISFTRRIRSKKGGVGGEGVGGLKFHPLYLHSAARFAQKLR